MKRIERIDLLAFTFFLLFLFSCNKKTESYDINTINVEKLKEIKLFSYKRPIDNCRFLPLQTTDDCLIGEIKKIVVSDELILVLDENMGLFAFTPNGKFINRICRLGQGDEELLSLVDFYINKKNKYIGVFDVLRSKMFRFDYNGKRISSHNCPKEMKHLRSILYKNGENLLLCMANNKESNYEYIEINENNYSFVDKHLPFNIKYKVSSSSAHFNHSISKNCIFTIPTNSDIIYNYTNDNSIKPYLFVKSKLKPIDSKLFDNFKSMKLDNPNYIKKYMSENNYSLGLFSISATNDFISFSYQLSASTACNIFYSQKTGKAYIANSNRSDFFGDVYDNELTTTDNEIVYAIQADKIISIREKNELFTDNRILDPIMQVKEDDNPVLVFFSSGL